MVSCVMLLVDVRVLVLLGESNIIRLRFSIFSPVVDHRVQSVVHKVRPELVSLFDTLRPNLRSQGVKMYVSAQFIKYHQHTHTHIESVVKNFSSVHRLPAGTHHLYFIVLLAS